MSYTFSSGNSRRMTSAFLALILVPLTFSTGAFGKTHPPLPKEWKDYIAFDQRHNVYDREDEILSVEDRAIQPVLHWDVPAEKAKQYVSKYLDPGMEKLVQIKKDGKSYVRFFMTKDRFLKWADMTAHFGNPEPQVFWGTKMQSKSTYFVWNPNEPRSEPFFVKMERIWRGDNTINHATVAENAVKMNDFVEELIDCNRADGSTGTVLPERFAASVADGDFTYAMSMRSTRPLQPLVSKSAELYPAHGVLGSPVAKKFAKRAGMTEVEWIKNEYIPAIAKLNAHKNLKEGIYLESHTQNLLLEIDPKTGKVLRADIRDLADVLIDPIITKLNGAGTLFSEGTLPHNILNESWHDVNSPDYFTPGKFFKAYSAQGANSFTKEEALSREYTAKFFREYIKNAEEILNKKLELPTYMELALKLYESPNYESDFLKTLLKSRANEINAGIKFTTFPTIYTISSFNEVLMQDIHESFVTAKLNQLKPELKFIPALQTELREAFEDAGTHRNYPLYFEKRSNKLVYAWAENGIWALEQDTGRIAAYGYGLPKYHTDLINAKLSELGPETIAFPVSQVKQIKIKKTTIPEIKNLAIPKQQSTFIKCINTVRELFL